MRPSRAIDISTGLFVLLGLVSIAFLATQITSKEVGFRSDAYRLKALFDNVGGLKPGAPVTMAGVTIGRVEKIKYDIGQFKAVVTLRIDNEFDKIPNDSDAAILTSGLLGGQYVGITPGGSEQVYKDGDRIEFVQDAIVLESLVSKFLFSQADKKPAGDAPAAAPAEPAAKE
jgi:phospholipid/cholesterol/gamma-HCH transport system substrate-binding protein